MIGDGNRDALERGGQAAGPGGNVRFDYGSDPAAAVGVKHLLHHARQRRFLVVLRIVAAILDGEGAAAGVEQQADLLLLRADVERACVAVTEQGVCDRNANRLWRHQSSPCVVKARIVTASADCRRLMPAATRSSDAAIEQLDEQL